MVDEATLGLTPVKSSEIPCTLMLPFKEVPSKVPEKVTSAGDPSSGMLMVKLNLSTLKYPLMTEAVPRLLVRLPEIVPALASAAGEDGARSRNCSVRSDGLSSGSASFSASGHLRFTSTESFLAATSGATSYAIWPP